MKPDGNMSDKKFFSKYFIQLKSFWGYAKKNNRGENASEQESKGEKQQDENRLTDGCLKVDKRT